MKKLLLTLLLLFSLGLAAQAEEATLTLSSSTIGADGKGTFCDGDITLSFDNSNTSFTQTNHIRVYGGNEFTVAGAEGITISKIVFSATKASYYKNLSANVGTMNNNTKTWTGESNKIVFTNTENAQARLATLVITYTKEVKDPNAVSISAATGETTYRSGETYEVVEGTEVTFTVENYEGATITASVGSDFVDFVDGSYTATISKTTEVTIEVEKGGKTTEASYKFVIKQVPVLDGTGWVLVTDAAQLAAGDMLIIASGNVAAGNASKENNRDGVSVTITENVLTYSEAETVKPLIVELGGTAGAWTLKTTNYAGTNGYLASATTGTNNHLKVQNNAMTASISIADSNADVKFDAGTFARVYIQKNKSSNLFACYSYGSQDPIQLYKYVAPEPSLSSESVKIQHYSGAGRIGVEYNIVVADCPADAKFTTEVKVLVNNLPIDAKPYVKPEAPASAPAKAMPEEKTFANTLYFESPKLKDADNVEVQFTAALNGKELVSKTAAPDTTTGIDDVAVDGEAPAEYYNLQGLRVSRPEAGQLYIKRQGGKAVKVRF